MSISFEHIIDSFHNVPVGKSRDSPEYTKVEIRIRESKNRIQWQKNPPLHKKLKIATWVELGCWTSSNSCYKPGSKSSRRNSWFRKHLMFLFFFYRWYFHLSVPGSSVYTNVAVGCVTLDWLANLNVRCELCKSKAMMIVFRLCYYIKVSCIWNSIFFL
jgi:hypothetical protein